MSTVRGPTLKLSNGVEMPAVGLGTWLSAPGEAKTAVKTAVKCGYRLIDTASVYKNEEDIGEAIKELIAEGVVKREELFVTTKVNFVSVKLTILKFFQAWAHEFLPGKLETALRASLKRLGLEYVDLYLAHVPTAFNDDMSVALNDISVEDIWKEFDHVYKLGLAKSVGVSNWNNDQIERVLKLGLTPVHNSQVELHLYFPQHAHASFCEKNGIVITSYATLGSPGRVNHRLPNGDSLNWQPEAPADLSDGMVGALSNKYNKTPAQILLRYALDRGFAIIPKSINPFRIKENFKVSTYLTLLCIVSFSCSISNSPTMIWTTWKHRTIIDGSSFKSCEFWSVSKFKKKYI